nr:MAG TPA: hypothetical protein [Caudoviricetes sp.]
MRTFFQIAHMIHHLVFDYIIPYLFFERNEF